MKAYAKANIFLKMLGFDDRNYHILSSRFVLLNDIFDEITISDEKTRAGFEIISDFKCDENIIFKAFNLLCEMGFKESLNEFFKDKSVKLIKNIPVFAGLGGGSSDCAAFLKMMNEELNLKLSKEKLINLSTKLGSDVAFFLSEFKSANVFGCGEKIVEFDDEVPNLSFIFPKIKCETSAVYKAFDESEYDFKENLILAREYEKLKTKDLLNEKNFKLNDLFLPCVRKYEKMREYLEKDYFLSGSGSSVFEISKSNSKEISKQNSNSNLKEIVKQSLKSNLNSNSKQISQENLKEA